ncbi:hypothetical protein KI387_042473, partial [Taxus chinensis]
VPSLARMQNVKAYTTHASCLTKYLKGYVVSWTAMIEGYSKKKGGLLKGVELFDIMPQRNVVSWNARRAAYAQNGWVEKAQNYLTICNFNILSVCTKVATYEQVMDVRDSAEDH